MDQFKQNVSAKIQALNTNRTLVAIKANDMTILSLDVRKFQFTKDLAK